MLKATVLCLGFGFFFIKRARMQIVSLDIPGEHLRSSDFFFFFFFVASKYRWLHTLWLCNMLDFRVQMGKND